jgi:hypothetical protein
MNFQVIMGLLRFVIGKELPSLQRSECLHIPGHAVQERYIHRRTLVCYIGRSGWGWQGNGSNASKDMDLQHQSCEILKYRIVNVSYTSKSQFAILWKLCDEGNCLRVRIIC